MNFEKHEHKTKKKCLAFHYKSPSEYIIQAVDRKFYQYVNKIFNVNIGSFTYDDHASNLYTTLYYTMFSERTKLGGIQNPSIPAYPTQIYPPERQQGCRLVGEI